MTFLPDEEAAIHEIEQLSEEDLIEQIKDISVAAWDGHLEKLTINVWLNNFTGEFLKSKKAERNLALWLTSHFVFYTDTDVRSLSVHLWWKFIHNCIEEFESTGFMKEASPEEKYQYIVDNSVIQPLGNCGGSGTNVCYLFRQANGLKKEMFDLKKDDEYKYLILVDDATVSGYQANEYLQKYAKITDKKKYVLTYISTDSARTKIADLACLISSINLDLQSKSFHINSYVFSRHPNWLRIAKKMCKYYGRKVSPKNPLGYRGGEYLFGFYYNIPNNTLPIFWGTLNGWRPLFNRYFCDFDKLEASNSEKFY